MVIKLPGRPQKSVLIYKAKLLDSPQAIDRVRLPAKKIKKDLLESAMEISFSISNKETLPDHLDNWLIYFVVVKLE